MANLYLCILASVLDFRALNSYFPSLSAPQCTFRVQFPQEDETWQIITVSSWSIESCFAHVLFWVQPSWTRTQMHRCGLSAALQKGSEGYLSLTSGIHWVFMPAIPRWSLDQLPQPGRPFSTCIPNTKEQPKLAIHLPWSPRTTAFILTFAFLKSPRSFLYDNSISLYMSNASQADFC